MLIDVTEAARRHASGEATLVDVRNSAEWAAGHIAGAVHIPMADLPSGLDRTTDYMIICRSGGRSAKAVTALAEAGYAVVDVFEGMLAWQSAGLEMQTTNGATPRVIAP